MQLKIGDVTIVTEQVVSIEWAAYENYPRYGRQSRVGIRVNLAAPYGSFGYLDGGAGEIKPYYCDWYGPQAVEVRRFLEAHFPPTATLELKPLCLNCGEQYATNEDGNRCQACAEMDQAADKAHDQIERDKEAYLDDVPF